jgi:DNA invertase Pin-like site-specific DNA recombinase
LIGVPLRLATGASTKPLRLLTTRQESDDPRLVTRTEFERGLIRERQREGIAIAKAKGVYKGRKKALGPVEAHELVAQAHAGIPKADLARAYGISRETVDQYLRQN